MRIDKTIAYYYGLAQAVQAKEDAGFQTSVTDTWGRALSYQFFEEDDSGTGGANITWSSIRNLSSFQDHLMPYQLWLPMEEHLEHTLLMKILQYSRSVLTNWGHGTLH